MHTLLCSLICLISYSHNFIYKSHRFKKIPLQKYNTRGINSIKAKLCNTLGINSIKAKLLKHKNHILTTVTIAGCTAGIYIAGKGFSSAHKQNNKPDTHLQTLHETPCSQVMPTAPVMPTDSAQNQNLVVQEISQANKHTNQIAIPVQTMQSGVNNVIVSSYNSSSLLDDVMDEFLALQKDLDTILEDVMSDVLLAEVAPQQSQSTHIMNDHSADTVDPFNKSTLRRLDLENIESSFNASIATDLYSPRDGVQHSHLENVVSPVLYSSWSYGDPVEFDMQSNISAISTQSDNISESTDCEEVDACTNDTVAHELSELPETVAHELSELPETVAHELSMIDILTQYYQSLEEHNATLIESFNRMIDQTFVEENKLFYMQILNDFVTKKIDFLQAKVLIELYETYSNHMNNDTINASKNLAMLRDLILKAAETNQRLLYEKILNDFMQNQIGYQEAWKFLSHLADINQKYANQKVLRNELFIFVETYREFMQQKQTQARHRAESMKEQICKKQKTSVDTEISESRANTASQEKSTMRSRASTLFNTIKASVTQKIAEIQSHSMHDVKKSYSGKRVQQHDLEEDLLMMEDRIEMSEQQTDTVSHYEAPIL